jgi:hypothetical protein
VHASRLLDAEAARHRVHDVDLEAGQLAGIRRVLEHERLAAGAVGTPRDLAALLDPGIGLTGRVVASAARGGER